MARDNRLIPFEDQFIDLLPSPGYRFVPTDQELIRYYLRPKVANRNLPRWNVISDRDLYKDEEPVEIFGGRLVNEMYFFTPIKKKYQNGKNIDRVINGKGAWKAQGTKEVYDDLEKSGKKLMGFKTTLNFVSNKMPSNGKNTSWIMHEYTLIDDEHKCALCRIKRGRGNTINASATGGVGGVSPPRILINGDRFEEDEEEDNKLAATAALFRMSARANLETQRTTAGEIQSVEVQQLSDGQGSDNSTCNKTSESDEDNQSEVNAPNPKDKGKVTVDDSEPETIHVGSPKRYTRRINGNIRNNLAMNSSNVPTAKADTSIDNLGFTGPSKAREPLAPSSMVEPTFDIVNVENNREIVSKSDPTFKSSKVPLPQLQNDAHHGKVASPPDDLMQVISDSYDQIQLAGIAFCAKYYSLEKRYEKLRGCYVELESELAKMKKELADKDLVISEKDWENKTLHDVLRNEKAYKRKLEDMQADSEKSIDSLKVQLHKAKRIKYTKLSDLSPKRVPFDKE